MFRVISLILLWSLAISANATGFTDWLHEIYTQSEEINEEVNLGLSVYLPVQGGTGTSTAQSNGIFYFDGLTYTQDMDNFVYLGSTTPRVGIATATPAYELDVFGTAGVQGLQFDLNNMPSQAEGLLRWNTNDGTLELGMPGGNVNLQVGQELLAPKAKAIGSNINNGQLVYVSGGTGNNPEMTLAQANSTTTSANTIAMATEDVAQNQFGFFTSFGLVRELDTSSYTAGTQLYLDPSTAGGFTSTKPTSPNYAIKIGTVIRQSETEGIIFVNISQRGVNFVDVHGLTTGSIPFGDANGFLTEDNSNLFWDDTNNRLGIGSTSPSQELTVNGDIYTNGYFYGQPITGHAGSGIIKADSFDSNGNLSVTHYSGELDVSYPDFTVRLVDTAGNENYCDITGATTTPADNSHLVYYVTSACNVATSTIANFITTDISPGGLADFMTIVTHSGQTSTFQGSPIQNKVAIKARKSLLLNTNLSVINGFGLTEGTFPEFSTAQGQYNFVDTPVTATAQDTSTDFIEYFYRDGSGGYNFATTTDLTVDQCDDNSGSLVACSNPTLYRRYYIFMHGFQDGTDTSELHQLVTPQTETFTNIGNCEDVSNNPISYTLPTLYDYSLVPLYVYCGRPSDSGWTGTFIDIRAGGAGGTAGAVTDTSIFLTKDGQRPLTGNWDAGSFSITAANFIQDDATATSTFAGNVDITGNLEVAGTIFGSFELVTSGDLTVDNVKISGNTIEATNDSGLFLYDNASNGIFIEDGGNVGIGTESPEGQLEVENSGDSVRLLLDQDNTGFAAQVIETVDYGLRITGSDADVSRWLLKVQGNAGSTEAMYIGSNGNVGIGTTSPGSLLHIAEEGGVGTGQLKLERYNHASQNNAWLFSITNTSGNDGSLVLKPNVINADIMLTGDTSAANPMVIKNNGNVGIGTTSPVSKLSIQSTGTTDLLNLVETDGEEVFTVLESGNVGIGTDSPIYKFQIDGAGTGGNLMRLSKQSGTVASFDFNLGDNTLTIQDGSADNLLTLNATNNNVGIGTTTPYSKLSVWGDGTGTDSLFELTDSASTTLMTVLENGNVGIGTTSPAYSLDIYGGLRIDPDTGELIIPYGTNPTVSTVGEIAIDTTSGQFKFNDGSNTHILTGTTSPAFNIASTTLDASGNSFNSATSTFLIKNDPEPFTLVGFYCKASTTGTALVRFGDGTNWTEEASCSSGSATYLSTNNTFTAFEDFNFQASSTAGAVNRITITTIINKTAD